MVMMDYANVSCLLSVLVDITDRKRMEERLASVGGR
jgi:hypothetical protein